MTVTIPAAHAEAISERKQVMQQLSMHFRVLEMEDRRHVDAVLKSLGHNPKDYAQYDLRQDGDNWFLDLQKTQTPQFPPAPAAVPVNGAPQPAGQAAANGAPQPAGQAAANGAPAVPAS